MNLRFDPDTLAGEQGANILSGLIKGFFGSGGLEMQLNVLDPDILEDARLHPGKYPDLVVRVSGYCAYFDDLPVECVLASESFGAMAIVLKGVDGVPYLDKFAVTPEAQGAGLGAAVWQALVQRCPRFYWRSRLENLVTQWYYEQADASYTQGNWVAFSKGIHDFEQIRRCKTDSLKRAESWVEQKNGH